MNKNQLVERIAARTRLPSQDVALVVDSFIDTVRRAVIQGDKVVLSGFGTFHRKARGRRTARNIWADQAMIVKPTNVPAFRPGKPFKEAVARRRRPAAKRT